MKKNMTLDVTPATGHPELDAAVQNLYTVFARYPAPTFPLDVCLGCCVDPKVERELRELPLRSLTAHHFYEYNDSAKGQVQPVGEVKYLLPRLLELLAQGADLHHSTELYLDRLGRCDPQAFTPIERDAIDRFAIAHFRAGLGQWPIDSSSLFMGENAFSILLMWEIGGVDVSPLLVHWLSCDSETATLHYIDASHWDFWKSGGCFSNAFADERGSLKDRLRDWMTDSGNRRVFAQRILALVENGLPNDWLPLSCYADLRQRAGEVFDALAD
mgnify:CR=1 FL=1